MPIMEARGGGLVVNLTSGAADLAAVPDAGARSEQYLRIGERVAYGPGKAALNRLTNVIAPELRDLGIAIVAVDPGFTRTELVQLLGEHGLVDPEGAVPMEVPAAAVLRLVTARDPMSYTGQILRAARFVEQETP
jgi:NAD(P)-dependent dehydrogenase (short-subunit alcohol dehydrogenase family)